MFQNGRFVEGVRFPRSKQTIELTLESVSPNKHSHFEISLPSWSNPKLIRISRTQLLDALGELPQFVVNRGH